MMMFKFQPTKPKMQLLAVGHLMLLLLLLLTISGGHRQSHG